MKTITVSRQARVINTLLEQARAEDLILKAADGSKYKLTIVDDYDREIAATRRNKKLMAYLDECARETDLVSMAEVRRELGLPAKKKASGRTNRSRGRKK